CGPRARWQSPSSATKSPVSPRLSLIQRLVIRRSIQRTWLARASGPAPRRRVPPRPAETKMGNASLPFPKWNEWPAIIVKFLLFAGGYRKLGHARSFHPADAAIRRHQARASPGAALLPPGRLLRIIF